MVTLRKVTEIKEHPNADALELALIDGWQCCVKKGEFIQDELVVFFEIDSLLPVTEEFEFLRKSSYVRKEWLEGIMPNAEGFRLRSIKLRKELSQGLVTKLPDALKGQILHLANLQASNPNLADEIHAEVFNKDYSEYFGVIKYDPPQRMNGQGGGIPGGNFPHFIPKTDQERIQNIPTSYLQQCIDDEELFEVTQKYHGSSITVFYLREDSPYIDEKTPAGLGICSRNINLKIEENPDNHFVKTALEKNLHIVVQKLSEELNIDIAIQGELCGPGINQNWHGLEEHNIFIFDIYNITERRYFLPDERLRILKRIWYDFGYLGTSVVNLYYPEDNKLTEGFLMKLPSTDRGELLKLAEYKLPNGKPNEGLVFKSAARDFSFKAVSNEFLLNGGEESES